MEAERTPSFQTHCLRSVLGAVAGLSYGPLGVTLCHTAQTPSTPIMSIYSRTLYPVLALCALVLPLSLHAQEVERDVSVQSQETARLDGFSYQEGPESHLAFRGTAIALGASGEAEVEFQDGRARVDVDVKKLPEVSSLGPFATYVLWAVTAGWPGVRRTLGDSTTPGALR